MANNKPKKNDVKRGNKKGKKPETTDRAKAKIVVILDENQASKLVKSAKYITIHELARQTGVKISAANAYLSKAVQQGTVKIVGGHSGHRIYQPVP